MRPSRPQASQEPSDPPPTGRRPITAIDWHWPSLERVGRRARRRVAMAASVVLLCGLPLDAAAQHLFDSWTTENGLPQNSVNDILQTRDGYLWLATHGGLVRFDGVRFVVFDRSTLASGANVSGACTRTVRARCGREPKTAG